MLAATAKRAAIKATQDTFEGEDVDHLLEKIFSAVKHRSAQGQFELKHVGYFGALTTATVRRLETLGYRLIENDDRGYTLSWR